MDHHWSVLKNDRILGTLLPERPKVIYKGAPSLRSKIASNVINPPVRASFFHNLIEYYPCKRCTVCQFNICGRRAIQFTFTITKRIYPIKHFCTCATTNIVYLLTCPCGKQYVGRTIPLFATRVAEHINKIKNGHIKHTVSLHYSEFHNQDPKGTEFLVIDRFIPPWRGGATIRGVSRLETYWIYELQSHSPFGMNVNGISMLLSIKHDVSCHHVIYNSIFYQYLYSLVLGGQATSFSLFLFFIFMFIFIFIFFSFFISFFIYFLFLFFNLI